VCPRASSWRARGRPPTTTREGLANGGLTLFREHGVSWVPGREIPSAYPNKDLIMNPVENLVRTFQELVTHVPEFLQPLIVALAGAVPFIEGEGASGIGIVGGLHPLVALASAVLGNFLAVFAVVVLGDQARTGVRQLRAPQPEPVAVGASGAETPAAESPGTRSETEPDVEESKGRRRVRRWLARFGVPGASILGPLAIPTHLTAAVLVASGASRSRVLLWQAVAMVLWAGLTTVLAWITVNAVILA